MKQRERRPTVNMSTEELSASDSEAVFAGAGERWAPVGAVASPEDESGGSGDARQPSERGSSSATEDEMSTKMKKLEEEQELLNSSLLALTSHFAQVQFRLKQIVHAQSEEKEKMLAELEEFAFRGCPHVVGCRAQDAKQLENSVRETQPVKTHTTLSIQLLLCSYRHAGLVPPGHRQVHRAPHLHMSVCLFLTIIFHLC